MGKTRVVKGWVVVCVSLAVLGCNDDPVPGVPLDVGIDTSPAPDAPDTNSPDTGDTGRPDTFGDTSRPDTQADTDTCNECVEGDAWCEGLTHFACEESDGCTSAIQRRCDEACDPREGCLTLCDTREVCDEPVRCEDGWLIQCEIDPDECLVETHRDPCPFGCDAEALECASMCGNGILDVNETCEDGNDVAGDGCDPDCNFEPPVCGDGAETAFEWCDSGTAGCPQCSPDLTDPPGSVSSAISFVRVLDTEFRWLGATDCRPNAVGEPSHYEVFRLINTSEEHRRFTFHVTYRAPGPGQGLHVFPETFLPNRWDECTEATVEGTRHSLDFTMAPGVPYHFVMSGSFDEVITGRFDLGAVRAP